MVNIQSGFSSGRDVLARLNLRAPKLLGFL